MKRKWLKRNEPQERLEGSFDDPTLAAPPGSCPQPAAAAGRHTGASGPALPLPTPQPSLQPPSPQIQPLLQPSSPRDAPTPGNRRRCSFPG